MATRNRIVHVLLGLALALFIASPVQAFHFPWDQGHDTFQPNPPDDSQEPECPHEDNRCNTSDPVDIGVGDKVKTYVDFSFPGFGPELALTRTYHSQDLSDGPFGFGWHTDLTTRLLLVTDGETTTAIVVQGNGKRKRFEQQADESWASAAGTYQSLTVATDGSAELRDKNGTTRYFDRFGRLTRIEDRNGNALTVAYDAEGVIASATAASGRTLTFTKGADGRIASVTDPLGRSFQYEYDTDGYMTKAIDPDGGETLYTYYADSNLHTVVDARGNTAITLTFDGEDRVIREVLADGATYQFAYLSATQTRVTNPRGFQTLYTFNSTGQPTSIVDPLNRTTRSTWDANYNRLSHTDGNGHTTTYAYDTNGNLLTETDALGQVTSYSYESTFNQIATETDPDGFVTTYAYDGKGNRISKTDALGNVTTMTYDGRGLLASTMDPLGNTATFEYDAAGNLIRTTDALGQKTSMSYDSVGNLLSLTDARGHTTTFAYDGLNQQTSITDALGGVTALAYDANGNRTQISDPKGNLTTFAYDARNRLTSTTNALGHTEARTYDAKGNLTAITDANANTTSYTYDGADQRIAETRPGSAVWSYEYDAAGNRAATVDPSGVRMEEDYDALNRLIARRNSAGEHEIYQYDARNNRTLVERRTAGDEVVFSESTQYDGLSRPITLVGGVGQTTLFDYDANSNLTNVTDPLGRVTSRSFDPLNRLVQVIDAANALTGLDYDAVGNLTGVTDPRGLTTTYAYDALDRQTTLDSPDTGATQSSYDANANLIARTDSRGVSASHSYDALDRRTATTYPDPAEDRSFRYDEGATGKGRLTGYDDPSGRVDLAYDDRGNLIAESRTIQAQSYSLGYGYDGVDRLTRIDYPSGLQVTYAYDGQGRILSVGSDAGAILDNIAYLPFGPIAGWTDGSGATRTLSYDADYRITSITVPGLLELSYSLDEADNITALVDDLSASRSQTFAYDAVDRLTDAAGGYGTFQFIFDPIGNRLTEDDDGLLTQYVYGIDNNRLLSATGADANSFIYDVAGNQIADSQFTSRYNQANRLAEIKLGTVTVAEYLYNADGQRVAKSVDTTARHFLYGRDGQLLGVYDATTGTVIEEIVYLGTTPVATLRSGDVFFVHTDHLGTPRTVSDGSQQIVWRWDSDPIGEHLADQDPDEDGQLFTFGLRFPGQYFDQETGLHYNYFRDYDPATGRYVESDPIGLAGGINTYNYTKNNPLRFADPTGLCLEDACIAEVAILVTVGQAIVDAATVAIGIWALTHDEIPVTDGSDPDTAKGLKPVDPGRDCNGNCNPCPPDQIWAHPGDAHGSTGGIHYHGLVWNQNPKTCVCYPNRVSGPTPDSMK